MDLNLVLPPARCMLYPLDCGIFRSEVGGGGRAGESCPMKHVCFSCHIEKKTFFENLTFCDMEWVFCVFQPALPYSALHMQEESTWRAGKTEVSLVESLELTLIHCLICRAMYHKTVTCPYGVKKKLSLIL